VKKLLFNLREKRIEKGFTQESLANEAGVVRQTISEIERGANKPSVDLAQKIGKILEFNWSEFFEGNE
jgi:DNA-binding XRE family transcriptional regulator